MGWVLRGGSDLRESMDCACEILLARPGTVGAQACFLWRLDSRVVACLSPLVVSCRSGGCAVDHADGSHTTSRLTKVT